MIKSKIKKHTPIHRKGEEGRQLGESFESRTKEGTKTTTTTAYICFFAINHFVLWSSLTSVFFVYILDQSLQHNNSHNNSEQERTTYQIFGLYNKRPNYIQGNQTYTKCIFLFFSFFPCFYSINRFHHFLIFIELDIGDSTIIQKEREKQLLKRLNLLLEDH